ncbi:MAG TPA: CHAD domain-containing protein, partial [Polyangiaceae bacterium]
LHRVRLSIKSYRYALEALLPILPGEARELSTRVAGLQDQLGAAHDAHVLAETARESAKARGARHPRQLEALASDLEKTSRAAQQNSETALRSSRLEWPLPSPPSRQ